MKFSKGLATMALAMAVLPASFHIDLHRLQEGAGAKTVGLAGEADFRARFPGCETGAMPPDDPLRDTLPARLSSGNTACSTSWPRSAPRPTSA